MTLSNSKLFYFSNGGSPGWSQSQKGSIAESCFGTWWRPEKLIRSHLVHGVSLESYQIREIFRHRTMDSREVMMNLNVTLNLASGQCKAINGGIMWQNEHAEVEAEDDSLLEEPCV